MCFHRHPTRDELRRCRGDAAACDALDAFRALVLDALAEVDKDIVATLHLLHEHFFDLSRMAASE